MTGFLELGIRSIIDQKLKLNGINEPTEIQDKSIPIVLEGKDLIAQAQTGTGKTLAFLLPILEKINPNEPNVQALIVSPTRELALQITEECKNVASALNDINVLAVYGGQDVEQQMKKLKRATHIVIGTPGRLLDHMRRETIDLSNVRMFVLDEADQMLHLGFLPEMKDIMDQLPTSRQTMLFSATMTKQVRSIANEYMKNPADIRVKNKQITVEEIDQLVIETTDRAKQAALRMMMDQCQPFLAIIFCRTKRRANTLNDALKAYGYLTEELHGDLSQAKREKVMKLFREAKIQYLVATDVAARGIDVEGVTHVFNYDIPEDVESYIHRIGRTGRAGGDGMAITFVAPKDRSYLEMIEKGIKMEIEKKSVTIPKEQLNQTHNKTRNDSQKKYRPNQGNGNRRRTSTSKKPSNQKNSRRSR